MDRDLAFYEYRLAEYARKLLLAEERGLVRSAMVPKRERQERFRLGLIDDQIRMNEMDLALLLEASWILHWRLRGCAGWPEGNWIDLGILVPPEVPWAGIRARNGECAMAGLAIWSDDQARRQWVEPFVGTVRVSPDERGSASYDFAFVDATKPLGLVPYGGLRAHDWGSAPPATWRFAFSRRMP